ncbi:MAG: NAD(P)H-binding protein [Clostridia bacterium]
MWRALVAGATGLVGQQLLRILAAEPEAAEVGALVRRALPPGAAAGKVREVRVDFDRLGDASGAFRVDKVFCALGTTIKQAGSQEAFRRVDYDYPLALAKAARAAGVSHFLVVTAYGSNARSRVFYSRVKGELEEALQSLGFASLTIARPSMLVGREPPRRTEGLAAKIGWLVPDPWRPVHARQVAAALVAAARVSKLGVEILDNTTLVRTRS